MSIKSLLITGWFLVIASSGAAQHRGDDLAFQGVPFSTASGVKSTALGNAYTAYSGDLNTLYHNPAGLAAIAKLQVSVSANRSARQWRENQVYRPNRMFWTMAYYLEGLYIPDPKNNGRWDYELAQDTSYHVTPPETGLEPFSEEAADWQKKTADTRLLNIGVAVPLKVAGMKWVASAAWSSAALFDHDRNDTYLDPHIGYDAYGMVPRVVTDTVRFSWSRFLRDRAGDLQDISAGLALQAGARLDVGVSVNILNGTSTDLQSLNRVGYFDIAKDNRFRFSYDTLDVKTHGTSDYSATRFKVGALLKLERLHLGFSLRPAFTMTRKWSYETTNAGQLSGEETLKHPATWSFGASLMPIDAFRFMLDYECTGFSDSRIEPAGATAAVHHIPDITALRCGIEFKALPYLALLAGYGYTTAVFVPDGAAIKELGPAATTIALGAGVQVPHLGRLDLAYEMHRFKYYDSYFSNTNYVSEARDNVLLGWTYGF